MGDNFLSSKRDFDLIYHWMCHFRMLQASTEGLSSLLQIQAGRIKVIGTDSSDYGYLGDGSTATLASLGAGASATEALSISYVPTKGFFELEIKVA